MGGNLIETLRGFGAPSTAPFSACFTGFFVALIVGTFVIRFAMRWLENGSFTPFVIYCLMMGAVAAL
jgi:undecaprenyl pyrophosphate phosphatase UppP